MTTKRKHYFADHEKPEAPVDAEHEAVPAAVHDLEKLDDAELDRIAGLISQDQIDRLVRMRARLERRDAYRRQGISPSTHIVTTSAVVIMARAADGAVKRHEIDAGTPVAITDLDEETHKWLLDSGHAERPE